MTIDWIDAVFKFISILTASLVYIQYRKLKTLEKILTIFEKSAGECIKVMIDDAKTAQNAQLQIAGLCQNKQITPDEGMQQIHEIMEDALREHDKSMKKIDEMEAELYK